ncbi:MAG: circadian clock KaiB family protein [Desulfosalsimonas sp.]
MEPDNTRNWRLCFYVSGDEEKTDSAVRVLRQICEENIAGKYEIKVIDITVNPQIAVSENIIATPCLIKKQPPPNKKIIGDLTDKAKLLRVLGIKDDT